MELRPSPAAAATAKPSNLRSVLQALLASILTGVILLAYLQATRAPTPSSDPALTREVASKLKAAGALDEAARLYARYLENAALEPKQRASIAYSLGQLYLEAGGYEAALRWLYEAEAIGAAHISGDVGQKIVHTLERLGRIHAAQAALKAHTELSATTPTQRPDDDPLVAKIGNDSVHRSDVLRARDDLPPELRKIFTGPEGEANFLRKYVADQLLWHKAQKLEYHTDNEVRRQMESMFKQLVVNKFIEREVASKIAIDPNDVKNFFEANSAQYAPKDKDGKPGAVPKFEDVRARVEQDYRLAKFQNEYQRIISEELTREDVHVFADALAVGRTP